MHDPDGPEARGAAQPARDLRSAITTVEIAALAAGGLWLVALAVGFFTRNAEGGLLLGALRTVLVLAGVFLPLAVIALTAIAVRSVLALREEIARLQVIAETVRKAQLASSQAATTRAAPAAAAAPSAPPRTPSAPPPRTRTKAPAPAEAQPSLALDEGATLQSVEIAPADFVRALDFPADPDDREGFRALRRARADRRTAEMLQASQDLLTLLSEDGIYMEDLTPEPAPVETWRRFAKAERGRSTSELGGVRDEEAVEAVAARMRRDTIFRDTAHYFLRRFDHLFAEFEPRASDDEIAALVDTRSARAFMLLARASGTFD